MSGGSSRDHSQTEAKDGEKPHSANSMPLTWCVEMVLREAVIKSIKKSEWINRPKWGGGEKEDSKLPVPEKILNEASWNM